MFPLNKYLSKSILSVPSFIKHKHTNNKLTSHEARSPPFACVLFCFCERRFLSIAALTLRLKYTKVIYKILIFVVRCLIRFSLYYPDCLQLHTQRVIDIVLQKTFLTWHALSFNTWCVHIQAIYNFD